MNIFSDLNNLEDITIGRNFNTLAGITQRELEFHFQPEQQSLETEYPGALEKVREWYNGYSWGAGNALQPLFIAESDEKQSFPELLV